MLKKISHGEMPLNSPNGKAQMRGGRRVAAGWLLRIYIDVRALPAKAREQPHCVPWCVYLLCWQPLGRQQLVPSSPTLEPPLLSGGGWESEGPCPLPVPSGPAGQAGWP